MNKSVLTIAIADSFPLFRKGLSAILKLSNNLSLIGEASTGWEAIQLVSSHRPDILFLDLNLPDYDGFTVLKKLQEASHEVKTIVISLHCEKEVISKSFQLGAMGFLSKNAEPTDILSAINEVTSGLIYQQQNTTVPLKNTKKPILIPDNFFSEKELMVIKLLAEGLVSKEIAEKLFLSPRSVEDIRLKLMRKTQVHSVTALISYAYKNGLVEA